MTNNYAITIAKYNEACYDQPMWRAVNVPDTVISGILSYSPDIQFEALPSEPAPLYGTIPMSPSDKVKQQRENEQLYARDYGGLVAAGIRLADSRVETDAEGRPNKRRFRVIQDGEIAGEHSHNSPALFQYAQLLTARAIELTKERLKFEQTQTKLKAENDQLAAALREANDEIKQLSDKNLEPVEPQHYVIKYNGMWQVARLVPMDWRHAYTDERICGVIEPSEIRVL